MDYEISKLIFEKRISDVFAQIITKETEFYKAVILMGQSAIKSSLFINAGSLVTAMAFFNTNVQNIVEGVREYIALSDILILAMEIWLFNILLCVMSYGFAYLSEQRNYINFKQHAEELRHAVIESKGYIMPADRGGIYWGLAACGCIVITYVTFIYSIVICYGGFSCFVNSFK